MAGALPVNGAQSTKPVKFGDIYTGRIFSGIWTNRSPLRDAASTRIEEKFYGPRGDAMIAGSNVEISNKLTMIRRPGNPIYDNVNTFSGINSFDEFRISKPLSDVWGTTTESIDLMVDTPAALLAENSAFALQYGDTSTTVWTKSTGAGQSFMKQVGNQLYFGNGADNKKWSQSLFVRQSSNNNTVINTNSYPFIDTFLNDPNGNMQQMIGVWVANLTHVANDSNNILTITVGTGLGDTGVVQPVGTQFQLWNLGTATWLNGATITLTMSYTEGSSTTLIGTWTGTHAVYSASDTGYVQALPNFVEATSSPVAGVPKTGNSVPTWGTTVPSKSNDFYGSTTLDGNVLWQNRGKSTQNWGIAAPTDKLTVTATGAAVSWEKNTYYSPASVYIDNNAGFLWQVTTAGTTGATQPSWPGSPTVQKKVEITSVQVNGSNTAIFTTLTNTLNSGDTVVIKSMPVATFLKGATLTVSATGLSSTGFQAAFTHGTYAQTADDGIGIDTTGVTTVTDGTVVWTAIQTPASLTWAAHTHYFAGDFLQVPVAGVNNLVMLAPILQPSIVETINSLVYAGYAQGSAPPGGTSAGAFNRWNSSDPNTPGGTFNWGNITPDFSNVASTSLHWSNVTGQNVQITAVNGAGELGSNTDTGQYEGWEASITCDIWIPAAGTYTFTLAHDDGAYFAFNPAQGCFKTLGSFTEASGFSGTPHTMTAQKGYTGITGNNNSGTFPGDSATWVFPAPGAYNLEINWTNFEHASEMILTCAGQEIARTSGPTGTISSANQPAWPAFTIVGAQWDSANERIIFGGSVQESANQYTWENIGPQSDFVWQANTRFTLPGTQIVDSNSNEQGAYETGISGTTVPVWQTAPNAITADAGTLKWINEGPVPTQPTGSGKITATSAQGWLYAIALVNTLDNTVSNIGPVLSSGPGTNGGTGPVASGQITFAPGDGLNINTIDPQADWVAIFRTTDGFSTELLIPSFGNTNYTVPLTQYLQSGYVDTTPDISLDTLAQAPAAGENTPPLPGASNLTYHLNRLWYSIGNTVFYTSGPLDPVGNGINGAAPGNTDTMPSLVKRLVPLTIGVLVFTVSDVYIIPTQGGTIYPSLPYAPGIGISSYNALDINGPEIGFFTTDSQFLLFNPSGGLGVQSSPIADQLQLNNGTPGQSWSAPNVYVAHYAKGQDMAWFLADGTNGWYKLISTPAPDGPGSCWSPFATIEGGVKALKSVETSPGVHALVLGPTGSGKIRLRSVNATTDGGSTGSNGTPYPANAVFGSYVLVQPGQVAQVAFITTDSVNVGSPLILGVLIDEALPYFTGSFEILKRWESDPPGLPPSKSILGQRFYLAELPDSAAACRHMQILVQWPAEAAMNELQAFTIFGCIVQEQ
jgi:hypothetical protein